MLKLEQIRKKMSVTGLEPSDAVEVLMADPIGNDALTIVYKLADGTIRERMIFRSDEANLAIAQAGRPWSFDAPGMEFKLATEALRIDLAYLFDTMMAVHTSNVEPLPHQITAVYESMLPRQPLRYVLADDPGAGKTIMAGLYVRELMARSDARRILIVAPGSLVEQWQDEMFEKFGLVFTIFSREQVEQSRGGNPFEDYDLIVARVDQLARSDELVEKLKLTRWDLIIVDEAHKLSANYFGNKIKKTKRFQLGELLGVITRHFLLMTATPHNGKDEDFQLFMSLLDTDRFYGKFRDGVHQVDVSDLMRRMVKEDLLKFDGTKLFPERRAYTVNYRLSDMEASLYENVSSYVKNEFDKADLLAKGRKNNIGFALTALQRRLASSPEAIFQSLKRRHRRLKSKLDEAQLRHRGQSLIDLFDDTPADEGIWDSNDNLRAEEYENFEEEMVDKTTAAQTVKELEAEIAILERLEEEAKQVVLSNQDCKWEQLSQLLQNTEEMRDDAGQQRKLIIFTEHRDTLNYLNAKICGLIGSEKAIVLIHGGIKREERRKTQELFRNDPDVKVLIATDAAGEGVNLQNANLMINYDLPWNPNRLEQRFGRIHRIGQTEVCHLWNLVASETREGDVFHKLFDKLEVERAALGGRVFDILGEVFAEKSLRELLIEAIRYGNDPVKRDELLQKMEGVLDTEHLRDILKRNALCEEIMDDKRLFAVREEMEKAEARRLQPSFVRSFFDQAFKLEGGAIRPREAGRYEITNVPSIIRERDRQISGRNTRNINPVLRRYDRVCFDKQYVRLKNKTAAMAELLHPGHPLMLSLTDIILEKYRKLLKQGSVLIDPDDMGIEPAVILILDHAIRESYDPDQIVSRRLQFIKVDKNGKTRNAGWAPHLDLKPAEPAEYELIEDILKEPWLSSDLEKIALCYASTAIVPAHFDEVQARRTEMVDKTLAAVRERLVKEINYLADHHIKLTNDEQAGKDVRLPISNIKQMHNDLTARLQARQQELENQRCVVSSTPVILGSALVIPQGLLMQRSNQPGWTADAAIRSHIERIAMQTVIETEQAMGHHVTDVSDQKCGWDITSIPVAGNGVAAESRHIEVKGRAKGQTTITVTHNEILYALNQKEKFILAIVIVDGEQHEGPYYIRAPFTHEPEPGTVSLNMDLAKLLARAETINV
ncbi:MAG: DUF3883 domain-containing protein [Oxalobacter formigenes]|nr:DUF3883 domain-containing protein [Oxalobacter formigenes]